MKIRPIDFLFLVVIAALIWLFVIEPNIQPQPPVIQAGPTQPAPVVIIPTNPVYDIQVIEPAPGATATEANRAGWQAPTLQTGNTGSHDPGRTDKRNGE
jgi:hypothetical protein